MNNLQQQLIHTFVRLLQVVSWGDLLERTFRPVITPNLIYVRVSQVHWTTPRH